MTELNSILQTLIWSSPELEGAVISDELQERLLAEWESFVEQSEAIGFDAYEHRIGPVNTAEGDEANYAAHDWVLTRNGHGAGFWDGDWAAPFGDLLTAICKAQGEIQGYVGDDGLVYGL